LLSTELMVKLWMVPCGTSSLTVISGAGGCVGPMMKFPSSVGPGTLPSGSSLAVTKPGVFGSRVGGVGRGGGVVVCDGVDCPCMSADAVPIVHAIAAAAMTALFMRLTLRQRSGPREVRYRDKLPPMSNLTLAFVALALVSAPALAQSPLPAALTEDLDSFAANTALLRSQHRAVRQTAQDR
jgi:hypothetical protein